MYQIYLIFDKSKEKLNKFYSQNLNILAKRIKNYFELQIFQTQVQITSCFPPFKIHKNSAKKN